MATKFLEKQQGYANPACYLHFLGNCSPKMTNEHFMSKAMTRPGPGTLVAASGIEIPNPWPLATTAKIVCKNHNSALSRFDTVGITIYRTIQAIHQDQVRLVELDGNMLEAFLMQRLCAHTFGAIVSFNGKRIKAKPPIEVIEQFYTGAVDEPLGLSVGVAPKHMLGGMPGREFTPFFTSDVPPGIAGCRISIGVVGLFLRTSHVELPVLAPYYRPEGLRFWRRGTIMGQIGLKWRDGARSGFLDFNR